MTTKEYNEVMHHFNQHFRHMNLNQTNPYSYYPHQNDNEYYANKNQNDFIDHNDL